MIVTDILDINFQKFIDVDFTVQMESKLDEIEEGDIQWKDVVGEFYEPLRDCLLYTSRCV